MGIAPIIDLHPQNVQCKTFKKKLLKTAQLLPIIYFDAVIKYFGKKNIVFVAYPSIPLPLAINNLLPNQIILYI